MEVPPKTPGAMLCGALLDQLELRHIVLGDKAAQADTAAQMAAADKITVASFERRKPAPDRCREDLPHLSIRCLRSVARLRQPPNVLKHRLPAPGHQASREYSPAPDDATLLG